MGHQAQVEQLGVGRPVVVLLLLDPGIDGVLDHGLAGELGGHHLGHLEHREGLGELVEDPELTAVGRVFQGQLHAGQGVQDVEHAPGLASGSVHGQRVTGDGLDAEPVEDRSEHPVVVEPGGQVGVEGGLLGLVPVDDALVEVGGPDAPDAAGEHDVGAVVHLGQVVEGARLLRVGQHVGPPAVGDLDEALFDVDVGRAVLTHRPQLDQVDVPVLLGDGVEQVERTGHVVDLRVDGVLPVDHRVGRRALLGEVHDGVGPERGQGLADEAGVGQVADEQVHGVVRDLLPTADPSLQAGDRDQGVDPHLEVVAPSGEVVDDTDTVAPSGQVESGGPTQVAVTTEYQNIHVLSPSRSNMTVPSPPRSLRARTWTALLLPSVTLECPENCNEIVIIDDCRIRHELPGDGSPPG